MRPFSSNPCRQQPSLRFAFGSSSLSHVRVNGRYGSACGVVSARPNSGCEGNISAVAQRQDTIDDNTCSIRSSKSVEYCAHAELADEGLRVRFYATAVNEAIDSVLRNNVANKTTVAIESEGEPQPLGKGMRCARATMSELPERVVFTFAHDPDAVLSDPVNQILRYGIRVGNIQVVLCRLVLFQFVAKCLKCHDHWREAAVCFVC
jgi:hypothetical protein